MTGVLLALLLARPAPAPVKAPPPPPDLMEHAPPVDPDRSGPPEVHVGAPMALPTPDVRALGPGLQAELVTVPGVRKIEIVVVLHRGSVALCGAPTAACSALGRLMSVATDATPAEDLEIALDRIDAALSASVDLRDTSVRLAVPPENLDAGLALLRQVLMTPSFPKKELKLAVRDTIQQYTATMPSDLDTVARSATANAWFPATSPFGPRPDLDGWKKLKPATLAALHAKLLAEAPVTVLVVGDIGWTDLEGRLKTTLAGLGVPGERPAPIAFAPPTATRIVAVDMPGQDQVAIRMRVAAPATADPARIPFEQVHFALGGSFISRINRNLREEKGWTYGAGARLGGQPTFGLWDVSVDVATANAGPAIKEIEREIARVVAEGVTPEELNAGYRDAVQTWNRTLETSVSARQFYTQILDRDETVAEDAARVAALHDVDVPATQRSAAALIGESPPHQWVVVGDRAALEPQLTALGWQPTWISGEQAVAGDF